MSIARGVIFKPGSKEELLPGMLPDFQYMESTCLIEENVGMRTPWHWHNEVELFYMEHGRIEYHVPNRSLVFTEGSGGLINSNVLHMTQAAGERNDSCQRLHIFSPSFIGGDSGSRIYTKYIMPITTAPRLEIVPLFPDNAEHAPVLELLRRSFELDKDGCGFELRLRAMLSEIWCGVLDVSREERCRASTGPRYDDKIKTMLAHIHENYSAKLGVSEIAASAFISPRECFRLFHDSLNTTPGEYLLNYRLQKACNMLAETGASVTDIGQACGLGSSSYFGKTFRAAMGCTPMQYRSRWRYNDKK